MNFDLMLDWRTTLLLVTGIPALIAALMVLASARETLAARFFVALIAAWVLLTTPYIIGFSGAYQAYPWLTFAPFNTELWIGPLWLLTVRALTSERLSERWWLWIVPGVIQTIYYTACFLLIGPDWGMSAAAAEPKFAFSRSFHSPYIVPFETAIGLSLIAFAGWDSWRRIKRYRKWIGEEHSNAERVDLAWLQRSGAAIIALALMWLTVDAVATLVGGLSYPTYFYFYAVSGVVVMAQAFQFLARADRRFPKPLSEAQAEAEQPGDREEGDEVAPAPPRIDLAALENKVRDGEWHFDQDLTLGELARRIGTNSSALSAALNAREDGNFTSFINGLRVEAVCERLNANAMPGQSAPNLLDLALDCGFGSKATFNRAFKRHTGQSPRDWINASRAAEAA
ncbi:MAG: AraC family transcriptional regulator [Pseudomonadota bacterium]